MWLLRDVRLWCGFPVSMASLVEEKMMSAGQQMQVHRSDVQMMGFEDFRASNTNSRARYLYGEY